MGVLIFAIEAGRWGPARLPEVLKRAGLSVAALCPANNALGATEFLDAYFCLPATRSSKRLAKALADSIRRCRPQLIIPGDEQVVALLHAFVRQGASSYLDQACLDLIVRSLGRPESFDAMLMKSATLELAAQLSVRVPAGGRVTSAADAISRASTMGYPVYIKDSFGWSGLGVKLCLGPEDVISAMTRPPGWADKWKTQARK